MSRTPSPAWRRLTRTARWLTAAAFGGLALTTTTTTTSIPAHTARGSRRLLLSAAALAAAALLAACGSAQPAATPGARQPVPALAGLHAIAAPAARTYLGTLTGTPAFVGIVADGGHARAYVCDGTPHKTGTLADWFAGTLQGSLLDAASSQHHARLTARLGSHQAVGTLTLVGGQRLRFTIALAPASHRAAGIFAGTARWQGRTYQAGWIILPDGQQRGAAFFPAGPVRGQMIAISYFPSSPI